MQALIIEDDHMIAEGLLRVLRDEGIAADWVCDGQSGQQALESRNYTLALLDIGLPDKSGFDVLKFIRTQGNPIPLLILTARDGEDDCVKGLDIGADDYLIKPVGAQEILARVRAVLRRLDGQDLRLGQGDIALDPAARTLCYRGIRKDLSAREFSLMAALLQNQGTVLSCRQIEEHVYGHGAPVESNAVEVLIHGLRKKFDKQIIRNVRGIGWTVPKNIQ